ncbi:three-helix bundle dimerization domain-containing protein [Jannaschia sp. R86511]|uniref:three-helix bundle dimerization domain-containing protein n=1 Tax=Jannaschia sp. R86511 TaxID=3093853 RepID=UPI0036D3127B
MTEHAAPEEQSSRDRIVEEVSDKVERRPSVDASREEIRTLAEASVDDLSDKPVQTFTPLLAENEVVNGLMADDTEQREDEPDPA